MKKILVTASTFPRYMQDTEPRFIYDLCKQYTKHYDVTVLVPAAPGALDREEMEGMHVIRYHYFPIKKLETLCYPGAIVPRIKEKKSRGLLVPFLFVSMHWHIKKIIKEFDYVHSNWIIPQGIIQGFFKSKPYILSGLCGDVTSLNKSFVKKLKAKALKNAKYVTVVSEDLKKELKKVYGVNNVQIIPMGCDIKKFSPDNRKSDCFADVEGKTILFVGRLAEKKGLTYLIEAMNKIDATLIVVGDGPERKKLEEQAKPLKDKIRFVGPKNKDELSAMYASCDVFCVPSVIAEDGDKDGLPVALVEAMASGSPAIGSRVGGIAEIINDGKNGFLVNEKDVKGLADAVNKVLCDDDLRTGLSKEARNTAIAYDFENIGLKYKRMFETM